MRLPNDVRAAKCSERWMGLRSPVSCAKPTTSEDDTVFSSVSVMPTDRSSKNSVRSGGRFIRKRYHGCTKTKSHYANSRYYRRLRMILSRKPESTFRDHASLLGRAAASRSRAARIVPIRHALLDESIARGALQFLVVSAEFAGCHFLLCIDRETRPRWHQRDQSGRQKRVARHAFTPGLFHRYDSTPRQSLSTAPRIGAIKVDCFAAQRTRLPRPDRSRPHRHG